MRKMIYSLIIFVFSVSSLPFAERVSAGTPGGTMQFSGRRGFDSCEQVSYYGMSEIGNNSDFWSFGFYIGGVNKGQCGSYDSNWVYATSNYGWGYLPIYVGWQAPCSTYNYYKGNWSSDTAAYQAGYSDGNSAVNFSNYLQITSVVFLDIEGYNTGNTTCHSRMLNYLQGFINSMHANGRPVGAYGSSCDSGVQSWAGLNPPPDYVYIAEWYYAPISDQQTNVFNRSCVNNGVWAPNQRHHQYYNTGTARTYGGYTLAKRDELCSQAVVAGHGYDDGIANICPGWRP